MNTTLGVGETIPLMPILCSQKDIHFVTLAAAEWSFGAVGFLTHFSILHHLRCNYSCQGRKVSATFPKCLFWPEGEYSVSLFVPMAESLTLFLEIFFELWNLIWSQNSSNLLAADVADLMKALPESPEGFLVLFVAFLQLFP